MQVPCAVEGEYAPTCEFQQNNLFDLCCCTDLSRIDLWWNYRKRAASFWSGIRQLLDLSCHLYTRDTTAVTVPEIKEFLLMCICLCMWCLDVQRETGCRDHMCMHSTSITITAKVILADSLLLDLDRQCSLALLWAPLGTDSESHTLLSNLYLPLCVLWSSPLSKSLMV